MTAPRSRGRRALRAAGILAVTALVGLGPAVAGGGLDGGGLAPAGATTTDLGAELVVDRVTPQVLGTDQDLQVRVTVTNTSRTEISEPRLDVHLDRRSFISRSSLDRWRTAGTQDALGTRVLEVALPDPLAPGESLSRTVTVPAESIGLPAGETAWGPRGLAVHLVDAADDTRRTVALTRTFMLWFPLEEVTATRVSVLVPVVGGAPGSDAESSAAELEQLTAPGGRLASVLEATAEHSFVTWVVDPWLVDAATGHGPAGWSGAVSLAALGLTDDEEGAEGEEGTGGEDATDPETEDAPDVQAPPAEVTAWADSLVAATTNRDVQLLPYTDLDVGALAHSERLDVLELGREVSAARAEKGPLPDGAGSALTWPAEPMPDLATARAVPDGSALVVGPGTLAPPAILTYTPTARTTISTAQGDVTALVPDSRLSNALRTGGAASLARGDTEATGTVEPLSPAAAAQDLLAELAVITRERPSDGRHMLLTVSRTWEPDPAVASAQLAALDAAPWVEPEQVAALVGAEDPGLDHGTLPTRSVGASEVGPGELDAVATAVEDRRALAVMLEDPASVLGSEDLEVLAPASLAWREDPAGRADVVAASVARTAAVRDGVDVVPGSVVNLVSPTGELPVQVANSLDQAATVVVSLRPRDARLRADGEAEVTIPAGGEVTVRVPVHGIQSADVTTAVELRTLDGTLVDDSTVLTVRVRAEWEGIGTAVLGGLLALGVVIGVIRTIRRGRTGTRAQPVADSGPDDLSPEETR